MAKHLSQLTNPIKGYLNQANSAEVSKYTQTLADKNTKLPAALKLAIIRGESHVNLQCFEFFTQKCFTDDFIYQAYQKIYHDSHAVMEFIQSCGLIKDTEHYITQGISNQSTDYAQLCQQLYFLLVDHLQQHHESKLYEHATIGFMRHYFPSFYPKQSQIKLNLDTIKKHIQTVLNKQFHSKVTIKESFTTTENRVNFRLILWVKGYHAFELVEINAKRMRSARFKAYHRVFEQLQSGGMLLNLTKKTSNKKHPIAPLVD